MGKGHKGIARSKYVILFVTFSFFLLFLTAPAQAYVRFSEELDEHYGVDVVNDNTQDDDATQSEYAPSTEEYTGGNDYVQDPDKAIELLQIDVELASSFPKDKYPLWNKFIKLTQAGYDFDEDPAKFLEEMGFDPNDPLAFEKFKLQMTAEMNEHESFGNTTSRAVGWVGKELGKAIGSFVNSISYFLLYTVLVGMHWLMELVIPELGAQVEVQGREERLDKHIEVDYPGLTETIGSRETPLPDELISGDWEPPEKVAYEVRDITYIKRYFNLVRAISLWLLLILLVIAAFKAIAGSMTGTGLYTIRSILPRTVFAVVGSFAAIWVCQTLLDINWAMCFDVIGNTSLLTTGALNNFYMTLLNYASMGSAIVVLISSLVLMLLLAILFIVYQLRLATIIILIVLSPLAFVAYLLDDTQYITYAWFRGFIAVVFMQFFHVVIMVLFQATVLVGQEAMSTCLVAICMVYLMLKVPGMMLKSDTDGGTSKAGMASAFWVGRRAGRLAGI